MVCYPNPDVLVSDDRSRCVCAIVDFDRVMFVSSFDDGVWSIVRRL